MSMPGDVPGRLSIMPENIAIEHYGNHDVLDMMIWRHVWEQRDQVIIRAWKRGQSKASIGKVMGIGRTTVWRVIERYVKAHPECPHRGGE